VFADAEANVSPARGLELEEAAAGDIVRFDSLRSAAPPKSSGTVAARALIASELALRVGMPASSA